MSKRKENLDYLEFLPEVGDPILQHKARLVECDKDICKARRILRALEKDRAEIIKDAEIIVEQNWDWLEIAHAKHMTGRD